MQGISESSDGVIRKKNKKRTIKFLKSLGYKNIHLGKIIFAQQVFNSKIHICKPWDSGKTIEGADGLITNIPGQILAIITADCLPILLHDPKNQVVVALHGARECLIKEIVKNALAKMVFQFHSDPKEILVGIGPHIRKCHYWLKEKTCRNLQNSKFKKYLIYKNQKIYFDLTKIVIDQLLKLGIKRENIEDCKICTFCQYKKYFSQRKKEEDPKIYREKIVSFASFIGLKELEILKVSTKNFKEIIKKTIRSIKKGKVIIFPTDTVYIPVADATNRKAVKKVFQIKQRSQKIPIPIFVKNIKVAKSLARVVKTQEKFLKMVWPGRVTVVLKRKKPKIKLFGINKKTIAIRIPNYKPVNSLLEKLNKPLVGTSANISGKPASGNIKKVLNQFKNQKYQPDLVIDAGNLPKSKPSTVLDLTSFPPKILRP